MWQGGKPDGANKYRIVEADGVSHGEVQLTRGKVMKFDVLDLHHVEENYWCTSNPRSDTFYAVNTALGAFHTVVMGRKFVDHINRDGLDNRRHNLRPTNHKLNMHNHRRFKNDASGATGVCRKILKKRNGLPRHNWMAFWYEDGKERRKVFAIEKYGEEGAKEMAVTERKRAEERIGMKCD
jgi:hypothetical protein